MKTLIITLLMVVLVYGINAGLQSLQPDQLLGLVTMGSLLVIGLTMVMTILYFTYEAITDYLEQHK